MGLAIIIAAIAAIACVYVHLGALLLMRASLRRLRSFKRFILGTTVLAALFAHLLEIGVFAAGIYALSQIGSADTPDAAATLSHLDALYYSAASFTSLGGSPLPTPELRLLTAIEALTGLILISWTASFLFVVMQHYWGSHVE